MTPFVPRRVWPLCSALALLVAGCATDTVHQIKVDSIAKRDGANTALSYRIRSKDPRLGDESLRYKEASEFVRTALSGKGLYEAPNDERADMIVELDYGMETPRTRMETVSVPVYAQVGGGVRYETVPVVDARGIASRRTVAVYDEPKSELVRYDDVPKPVTMYEKYIRLTARENKPGVEGRPPAELWSVQVSAEDESKDLRKYLPLMASASVEYIGKDSTNQQIVNVREKSPGVEFIRRGMGDGTETKMTVTSSVGRPSG